MTMVAQARGTARHKKPATAISQPKGLERNLRNELIASPAIGTKRTQADVEKGIPTRLLLLSALG